MSSDSVRRFSERAGWYSKYRPGYPAGIISILEKEIGFGRMDVVADIGSGTGLLTKVFLENGNRVFAIEPSDQMRSYAEKELAAFRNFVSVKGKAERTTLPSGTVDLIVAGQALHWFDPAKAPMEFSRISRPGAHLCVVYNERKKGTRFMKGYGDVISRHQGDRAKVPNADDRYISRFFRRGRFVEFRAPNEQSLDFQGLMGRLQSASYMPMPKDGARYARFSEDVRRFFDRYETEGHVKILYDTEVFLGDVKARSSSR